jgi:hypothetical protein
MDAKQYNPDAPQEKEDARELTCRDASMDNGKYWQPAGQATIAQQAAASHQDRAAHQEPEDA